MKREGIVCGSASRRQRPRQRIRFERRAAAKDSHLEEAEEHDAEEPRVLREQHGKHRFHVLVGAACGGAAAAVAEQKRKHDVHAHAQREGDQGDAVHAALALEAVESKDARDERKTQYQGRRADQKGQPDALRPRPLDDPHDKAQGLDGDQRDEGEDEAGLRRPRTPRREGALELSIVEAE